MYICQDHLVMETPRTVEPHQRPPLFPWPRNLA